MDADFHTLQEFLTYSKGIIYLLILVILPVMAGFWYFLVERDED